MYQNGCNAYRHSAGNTVEDNRVVLLKLYDGALKFLGYARRGIMEKSLNIRGENISKVMAIVTELDCALDMDKGGELSIQLASLYRYTMEQLTAANQHNDLKALGRAERILMTLKEGFEAAVAGQKIGPAEPSPMEMTPPREGVRLAV